MLLNQPHSEEWERWMAVRGLYSTFIGEMKLDDSFYKNLEQQNIVPDEWADSGMEATFPPTGYNAIENASDHILTSPRIFVPLRPTNDEKLDEQIIAEKKRKFLASFWHQVAVDQGDPLAKGKKKLIKDGKLVIKMGLKWNLIPDLDDEADRGAKRRWKKDVEKVSKRRFLYELKVCANETIFEDPDNPHDPQFVYESYEIRRLAAKKMFPDAKAVQLGGDFDRISYVELWTKPQGEDRGLKLVWIDDELVTPAGNPNPYSWETDISTQSRPDYDGFVPYAIRDSGWGDINSEMNPEDRYVGMLRYMRSLIKAEARQLTAAEAQMRLSIFPLVKTVNMPQTADGESPVEIGPGKVNNVTQEAKGEGQDIIITQWPDLPNSTWQFLQKVQGETDRLSKFNVLGGMPQRGVDSATEADMNVRNSASKLGGPVAALQAIVTIVDRWVLQIPEKVLEVALTLQGAVEGGDSEITLTPKEINGYYETSVEFSTTDQAALDMRNAKIWADLARTFPGLSLVTAMEKAGIVDPMNEFVKRASEDVFLSPEARQARTIAGLMGMGAAGQALANKMLMEGQPPETSGFGGDQQLTKSGEGVTTPVVQDARDNAAVDQAQRAFGAGG